MKNHILAVRLQRGSKRKLVRINPLLLNARSHTIEQAADELSKRYKSQAAGWALDLAMACKAPTDRAFWRRVAAHIDRLLVSKNPTTAVFSRLTKATEYAKKKSDREHRVYVVLDARKAPRPLIDYGGGDVPTYEVWRADALQGVPMKRKGDIVFMAKPKPIMPFAISL